MLALLQKEVERFGLALGSPQLSALARYVQLLCRWGRRMNLVGRPEPSAVITRHLADAFALAAHWPASMRATCADIGSGAGLPGLPLAIALPGLRMTLVEPNQRRSAFLRTAVHEVGIGLPPHGAAIAIVTARVEEAGLPPQDVLCSRATWAPAKWLELASSLLAPGGVAVVFGASAEGYGDDQGLAVGGALLPLATHHYSLADGTPRFLAYFQRRPAP